MIINVCSDIRNLLETQLKGEEVLSSDNPPVPYYELDFDLDKVLNHLKECDFCRGEFSKGYKSLPIPPMLKILTDGFINSIGVQLKWIPN